ncbi:single-stranded nucleic acid binding R3H [Kickxella alabastrina]|uniref:single-stranded nucleic acid binding R3H n=1 Tax=Kickxella alabastrina TaxID=61397 RepID=UPI002221231F|nr:single-stranded nucleic acid binding R3H [Kickxella alabastrina]KAI7822310.1 single-stranded nucleic acid binding R3H [Kickxella alabastrina]KAJ1946789.1 hypothetical protein GGF37_000937 [Kickxella alabastrina]
MSVSEALQPAESAAPQHQTNSKLVTVDPILATALSQNQGDRDFVLQFEQQVSQFILQPSQRRLLLSKQNSYRRLLLHKLGDHYDLIHVVVGRGKDEMAFYKKDGVEMVPLESSLGNLVAYEGGQQDMAAEDERESGEAGEADRVSFTKILVKSDGGRSKVKVALKHSAGSTVSIEQRQAEYERTRAEIFQDTKPAKETAEHDSIL